MYAADAGVAIEAGFLAGVADVVAEGAHELSDPGRWHGDVFEKRDGALVGAPRHNQTKASLAQVLDVGDRRRFGQRDLAVGDRFAADLAVEAFELGRDLGEVVTVKLCHEQTLWLAVQPVQTITHHRVLLPHLDDEVIDQLEGIRLVLQQKLHRLQSVDEVIQVQYADARNFRALTDLHGDVRSQAEGPLRTGDQFCQVDSVVADDFIEIVAGHTPLDFREAPADFVRKI